MRAFAQARMTVPDLYLVVAGDGQVRMRLEALSDGLESGGVCAFRLDRSAHSPYATLTAAPCPFIEGTRRAHRGDGSAQSGCFDSVGGVQIHRRRVNGLFLPSNDLTTQCIVRLARSPELRHRLGRRATYAAAHHSQSAVGDVERLYHSTRREAGRQNRRSADRTRYGR